MTSDMTKQRFVRAWSMVSGWRAWAEQPLTEVSWLLHDIPALPACLVVAKVMAGADRASFPGLGDPACAGPVAQLVRAHA